MSLEEDAGYFEHPIGVSRLGVTPLNPMKWITNRIAVTAGDLDAQRKGAGTTLRRNQKEHCHKICDICSHTSI